MSASNVETPERKLSTIIFKNTAFALGGNFALKLVNFLFSVYVIRRLGDERFGQYSIVLSFVGLFQIFAELGMSQFVMREIARDREKTQSLILNLTGARMLLAFAAIGFIPLAARLYGYDSDLILGVVLYTCTFILAALQAPLHTLMVANERFDLASAMNIIGQITFVVLGSIFLLSGLSFLFLIIASLVSLIPQIILGLWASRRYHFIEPPLAFTPRTWPALVKSGLTFGMISLALQIAFGIDTVMLSKFVPAAEVGWYSVAYNLIFSIMFLTASFKDALVPSLARVYISAPQEVQRWYYRIVKTVIMLSLPIAVGGILIADPLIRLLYTGEFSPAIPAFQILVWDIPFLMFASFGGSLTTVIGSERIAAKIYILNAVVNVVFNLLFIPKYGYLAAAVITVVTDLIGAMQFHYALRHKLKLPSIRNLLFKVLIAVAVMGFGVWLVRNFHLVMMILSGVVIYGIMAIVLRLLDDTEWGVIQKALGRFSLSLPHHRNNLP